MASIPNGIDHGMGDMVDQMINGNIADQEDGRERFIASDIANAVDDENNNQVNGTAIYRVYGVRINCNGQQEEGEEKYIDIDLPCNDFTFLLKPTNLSVAMGLELIVHKAARPNDLIDDPEYYLNRTGAFLDLPIDVMEPEFGYYSLFLTDLSVGPMDVFRKDLKPITPKQVEAMAVFARFYINREYRLLTRVVFGPEEQEQIELERSAFVETVLTRREFDYFFEQFRASRMIGDPSWANEISPYEV
jgi:hypothetical protein